MQSREDMIGRAFVIAFDAHRNQVDKSGAPYIGHVVRVANAVEGEDAIAVALLHDVVEDCDVSLASLRDAFPDHIVEAVDAITHRPNEPRTEYYDRVKTNALALEVKLCDIADNSAPSRMALLDDETRGRLVEKYDLALRQLGAKGNSQ